MNNIKKKFLIFGANSDIANEFIKILKKKNYQVILTSKKFLKLKKKYKNEKFIIKKFDVTDTSQISNLLFQSDYPKNIAFFNGYMEFKEKNFIKILDINFISILKLIEKLRIIYKKKKKELKTIICLTSVAADRGKSFNNYYCSAKAGLSNYLEGLDQKIGKKTLIINIKPGYTNTKMVRKLNLTKLLITEPKNVANDIYKAYINKNRLVYSPWYWRIISFFYNLIPSKFLTKNFD